jgi:hypothetical protein
MLKICSLTLQLICYCRLARISKLRRQAKRQHTSGNQKHDVATQCNREGMRIDGKSALPEQREIAGRKTGSAQHPLLESYKNPSATGEASNITEIHSDHGTAAGFNIPLLIIMTLLITK